MIKVEHISKTYNSIKIIDDISFNLNIGDYAYVKGDSGAGKTTLLNILSSFETADEGLLEVDVNNIAYLPCGNCLLEALTIEDNIKLTHFDKELINKLKIENILNSYPRNISSGEYKRAALARTLGLNKPYILLDEPTSNLDKESANIIIKLIDEIKDDHIIIVATHDKRLMKGKEICLQKHQKEY